MGQFLVIIVTLAHTVMGCQDNLPSGDAWPGHYAITQTCDGAINPRYTLKVTAADASHLYLHNLGGYGKKVEATVQHDSLVITPTDVSVGLMGKVRLSGTGSLRGEEIFIRLHVRVPGPQGTTTTSVCALRGTVVEGLKD